MPWNAISMRRMRNGVSAFLGRLSGHGVPGRAAGLSLWRGRFDPRVEHDEDDVTGFLCWLGVAECASQVAPSASAASAAPEISAAPLAYAVAWVAGMLLIERGRTRRR